MPNDITYPSPLDTTTDPTLPVLPPTIPGWQTPAFWTAIISNVFAALVMLNIVPAANAATLSTAVAACVPALIALIANAAVIIKFIQSQVDTTTASTTAITQIHIAHLQAREETRRMALRGEFDRPATAAVKSV